MPILLSDATLTDQGKVIWVNQDTAPSNAKFTNLMGAIAGLFPEVEVLVLGVGGNQPFAHTEIHLLNGTQAETYILLKPPVERNWAAYTVAVLQAVDMHLDELGQRESIIQNKTPRFVIR